MKEYQVTVSMNGRFLFRTQWDNDLGRVQKAYDYLTGTKGFKVNVNSSDATMQDDTFKFDQS